MTTKEFFKQLNDIMIYIDTDNELEKVDIMLSPYTVTINQVVEIEFDSYSYNEFNNSIYFYQNEDLKCKAIIENVKTII